MRAYSNIERVIGVRKIGATARLVNVNLFCRLVNCELYRPQIRFHTCTDDSLRNTDSLTARQPCHWCFVSLDVHILIFCRDYTAFFATKKPYQRWCDDCEHGKQFFQRKSVEAHSDYQLVTCMVKDNLHCRQNHGEFRDLRARLEAKADLKRRQRKVCSRNLEFLYGL